MAYAFNGSSQYIGATSVPVSQYSPLTFAVWAYSANNTAALHVFAMSRASAGSGNFLSLLFRGDIANDPVQAIYAPSSNGNTTAGYSSQSFSATTWHQLTGNFASDSSREIYLDAQSPGSDANTYSGSFTHDRLTIGANIRTSISYLNGRACEAAVWTASLNADEINSLAKGFRPRRIRPQSLVFYAPLVRDIADVRGGLSLTNTNSATVADHPRVY